MDYTKCIELKSKNLVSVTQDSNGMHITQKQFDPNTGEEVDPIIYTVDLAAMQSDAAYMESRLEGLNQAILDVQAAHQI